MSFNDFSRLIARIKFAIDNILYQIMHYTLSNQYVRKSALKFLKPFPGVTYFLRRNIQAIQQGFIKKRILYKRRINPTMMLNKNAKKTDIYLKQLTVIEPTPRSTQDILQRIEQELG